MEFAEIVLMESCKQLLIESCTWVLIIDEGCHKILVKVLSNFAIQLIISFKIIPASQHQQRSVFFVYHVYHRTIPQRPIILLNDTGADGIDGYSYVTRADEIDLDRYMKNLLHYMWTQSACISVVGVCLLEILFYTLMNLSMEIKFKSIFVRLYYDTMVP